MDQMLLAERVHCNIPKRISPQPACHGVDSTIPAESLHLLNAHVCKEHTGISKSLTHMDFPI